MKHVHLLVKVSLILILALGFLRLEAHAVSAQDTNPPPAGGTTDGSSSAPDGSGGADTGGADIGGGADNTGGADDTGGGSGDPSTSSDSSPAGDDASGSAAAPDDEASDPADSSTSTDNDAASSAADTSTAASEDTSTKADTSTAAGDGASGVADDSPSAGEGASAAAPEAAGAEDSSSTDAENAEGLSEEGLSEESASEEGASDEGASQEAAEIIEDAAEKDITLADGDGQPIVAADTQAQELLTSSSSDPWFVADDGTVVGYSSGGGCAAGVGECHANEPNSIQAALNDARSAGTTIHIEEGDYSAEEFTLDDDTRSFNLAANVSVNRINLNTAYDFVTKVVGGVFSALNVWLNFGGPQTATLQDGVNLTESGGTLNVASKTYNENVTVASTKDGIHIVGDNTPILDGSGIGPVGIDIAADNVSISGLKIQSYSGSGISLTNGSLQVAGSTFQGNGDGIHIEDAGTLTSQGNLYGGNTRGIYSSASTVNSDADLFNQNYYGIRIYGGNLIASNNRFTKNVVGIEMDANSQASTSNNVFGDEVDRSMMNINGFVADGGWSVPAGVYTITSEGDKFFGKVLSDGVYRFGVGLSNGATGRFSNDIFDGLDVGLVAVNSTIDVVNSAISNTQCGVESNGANANFENDTFQNNIVGLAANYASKSDVTDSTFIGNSYAGAFVDEGSNLTSHGNLYEGNTRGIYSYASTVNSDGDTFRANTEDGILSSNSSLNVAGGTFQGNGYGIHLQDSSALTSQGNLYEGNTTGLISDDSSADIDGDTFKSNTDDGIKASGSSLNVAGSTFQGSTTGIDLQSGSLTSQGNLYTENRAGLISEKSEVDSDGDIFQDNDTGIRLLDSSALTSQGNLYDRNIHGLFGVNSTMDIGGDTYQNNLWGIISRSSNLNVAGSTFQGNDEGIYLEDASTLTSQGNTYDGNETGLYSSASTANISGDVFLNNIFFGILAQGGSLNVAGSTLQNNHYGIRILNASTLTSQGNTYDGNKTGLYSSASTANISGDVFLNNIFYGILAQGGSLNVAGSTFRDNKSAGINLSDESTLTSHGNTYTNNKHSILVNGNSTATIFDDNFEGNGTGVTSENPAGTQVHFSRFYNNFWGSINVTGGGGPLQADDNWWGDNQGAAGKTTGNVDFSDWLALDMSASDDPIYTGGETSQITTQMVSTDGATNTPLSALALAGIQGTWFNYTPTVNLQTPGMGTVAGDTFTSAQQAGQAHFTGTQFDDETPTAQVTIVQAGVPEITGNLPGSENPGSPAAPAPALQTVIPVTGAGLLDLACGGASQLTLANGNSVLIPALEPCGMQASLQPAAQDALPGPLPEGVTFVDGLTLSLVDAGGNTLDILPQDSTMQVSFAGQQVNETGSLAVYWWDGDAWQEVSESSLGAAASNDTGLFVLVKK